MRVPGAWVFDMDGVIANIDHRLFLIQDGESRWNEFHSSPMIEGDSLIEPTKRIIEGLAGGQDIIILSARPESARAATRAWLAEHRIVYDDLILRPDGDHGRCSAAEWKVEKVEELMRFQTVLGFFDDHVKNVKAVRELGVTGILYAGSTHRV